MKKFIVAAVLAIVLSFSLVVPAFAETPIRIIGSYYYPYSSFDGSGFGGGSHTVEPHTKTLTQEDFLSLYYGAVESNVVLSPRVAVRSAFECVLSNFRHLLVAVHA